MKLNCDFHIHTCLSPCGSDENTPCNVVNFAKLLGLDVIAITDHNTAGNVGSAMKVGKSVGLTVIAGMELTTAEDIHVVCLFETLEKAMEFEEIVKKRQTKVKNKREIFGNQLIMDEEDNITREEENLLILTSNIGIYDVSKLVKSFGGFAFPSHITREGSGVLPILGAIDKDMGFSALECEKPLSHEVENHYLEEGYKLLKNSDAHYLDDFLEKANILDCGNTPAEILENLRKPQT